ncbi:MAG: formimidoylglutamate deiminase [Boseongicola sp.]
MQKIHAKQALTSSGWEFSVDILVSSDGRIEAIAPQTGTPDTSVDLALPAPTNLHSHTFQRAMAGLTETRGPDPTDSFWTWRRLMYRFLERLTPDHVEAIAALAFVEMLEAGYGAVAEFHYLHHDAVGAPYGDLAELSARIVAAARETGIGLTLLPVLYSHGGCDLRPLSGGQLRFGNDFDRFAGLFEGAAKHVATGPDDFGIGVAPHSLRAVAQDGLAQAVAMAEDKPIHLHLAEQTAEVDEVVAHRGARPTEWLLDSFPVDERWCLIHTTQMNSDEIQRLAKTGAVAGLCPITESSLGDGIFNGTEYLAEGGRFGVGTDSNIHIAMFEELCTLEYSQRLRDRNRAALATKEQSTGRILFDAAANSGAQAADRNAGTLAPGHWADIIGLTSDNAWLCDRTGDTALDSLIFTGRGRDCITDVWSAGRHVVKEGRHIQRERVIQQFKVVSHELGQNI